MPEPVPHEFRVLGSETVFEGRVIALRRDTVSMPGGGAAMESMVISAFGFPSIALPVLLMMTQLFDAGCTLINSCGDTVASMLVSRFLYGKDWYKRDLNKELAEAENKE